MRLITNSVTKGSFNGKMVLKILMLYLYPNKMVDLNSWVPPKNLQNRVILKNGLNILVMNTLELLAVIVTIYQEQLMVKVLMELYMDLTKFSMEDAPPNHFFLEYISRPQTAEIFFEDVLMALYFMVCLYLLKTINLDFYII